MACCIGTKRFGTTRNSRVNAAVVSRSGMSLIASILSEGICCAYSAENPTSQEVSDRLPPTSSGASVITAQYTSTRCNRLRGRDTRQIMLKALSMVSISNMAVTARNTTPTAVRRDALSANCCM